MDDARAGGLYREPVGNLDEDLYKGLLECMLPLLDDLARSSALFHGTSMTMKSIPSCRPMSWSVQTSGRSGSRPAPLRA